MIKALAWVEWHLVLCNTLKSCNAKSNQHKPQDNQDSHVLAFSETSCKQLGQQQSSCSERQYTDNGLRWHKEATQKCVYSQRLSAVPRGCWFYTPCGFLLKVAYASGHEGPRSIANQPQSYRVQNVFQSTATWQNEMRCQQIMQIQLLNTNCTEYLERFRLP